MSHKKEIEVELINSLTTRYIDLETKENTYSLEKANLISEAKEKLPKKAWSKWLKDSRVRLKPSQAKKFIAISRMCKAGGQSTGLFKKEGIEKTYLIALVEDEELRKSLIEYVLKNTLSIRELKRAIQFIQEGKLPLEEAFFKATEKAPKENKQKNTVPLEQYQQVVNELNQIKERLKQLEERPEEQEQKIKKTNTSQSPPKHEKQEEHYMQPSLL
ncbi:MAG: hypothetical protein ACK481_08225 [Candidatus Melainabacteria bacterium]|jgi:hypothetical protein